VYKLRITYPQSSTEEISPSLSDLAELFVYFLLEVLCACPSRVDYAASSFFDELLHPIL